MSIALENSIFITGSPAAGKSTLTKQMAKDLDMPMVRLDLSNKLKEVEKDFPTGDYTPDYVARIKDVIRDELKDITKPSIVEGSHLMLAGDVLPDASKKILLDSPKADITKRYHDRQMHRAANKNIDRDSKATMEEAKRLYSWYKDYKKDFKKLPNVEVRNRRFKAHFQEKKGSITMFEKLAQDIEHAVNEKLATQWERKWDAVRQAGGGAPITLNDISGLQQRFQGFTVPELQDIQKSNIVRGAVGRPISPMRNYSFYENMFNDLNSVRDGSYKNNMMMDPRMTGPESVISRLGSGYNMNMPISDVRQQQTAAMQNQVATLDRMGAPKVIPKPRPQEAVAAAVAPVAQAAPQVASAAGHPLAAETNRVTSMIDDILRRGRGMVPEMSLGARRMAPALHPTVFSRLRSFLKR